MLPGLRTTTVLFFPLWLGYILTVDALVLRQRGTSLLTRSPKSFALELHTLAHLFPSEPPLRL